VREGRDNVPEYGSTNRGNARCESGDKTYTLALGKRQGAERAVRILE